jgi:hypothetical protein
MGRGCAVIDRLFAAAAPTITPPQIRVQVFQNLHSDPLDRLLPERRPDGSLDVPAIAGESRLFDIVNAEPGLNRGIQSRSGSSTPLGVNLSQEPGTDALSFTQARRRLGQIEAASSDRVQAGIYLHSQGGPATLD